MNITVRPLSPYLSIYRPQIGSLFSILQRISGIFLSLIFFFLLFLIFSKNLFISFYSAYYMLFSFLKGSSFLQSFFSLCVGGILFFSILLLLYHFCFSIRFLYWSLTGGVDKEFGIDLKVLEATTYFCGLFVFIISILIWVLV